jgi:hypothetical protein
VDRIGDLDDDPHPALAALPARISFKDRMIAWPDFVVLAAIFPLPFMLRIRLRHRE